MPSKERLQPSGQYSLTIPQAITIALVLAVPWCAHGQGPSRPMPTSRTQIPSAFHQHLEAAGKRFETRGQERLHATVTITQTPGTGASTAATAPGTALNLIWEYPGNVRFDSGAPAIMTSTQSSYNALPDALKALAAIFAEDTCESFLGHLNDPATFVRPIVRRAVMTLNGQKTIVDVVSVTRSSVLRNGQPLTRMFLFDSRTGLLRAVDYRDPQTTAQVRTTFDAWASCVSLVHTEWTRICYTASSCQRGSSKCWFCQAN